MTIQIIGHRGAKNEAPENTLDGFTHARKIGLDAVEFDIHLTKDHRLAVIHDSTVDRTTNETGPVADYTAAELAALDARGTCLDWPDPVGVPLLGEVLDVVKDFSLIQIEIKSDTPERLEEVVEGVLDHIRDRNLDDRALVTSFDAVAIEISSRLAPDQDRAFIGRPTDPYVVDTALKRGRNNVQFHRFREHDPAQIQRAHDADLIVGGGPCDSIDDLNAAIALGLTSVTSDVPSMLQQHLKNL